MSGFNLSGMKMLLEARLSLYCELNRFEEISETASHLLELDPENKFARHLVGVFQQFGPIFEIPHWLKNMQENYQSRRFKQWGKVLKQEATTAELVELFTKDELMAALATWGWGSVQSNLKKRENKSLFLKTLNDEAEFQTLVNQTLDEEARKALKILLEMDGYAPYQAWQEKAGFKDDLKEVHAHASKNFLRAEMPCCLVEPGLVYLGEVQPDQLMALIPADLSARLNRFF